MATPASKIGVLLVNLGTPDAPDVASVRRYLREFLSDPKVIDSHPVARWLLLNLIILPFRPRRSAAAYQKVWTEAGSPLLVAGQNLAAALSEALGDAYHVELAMRYGSPSIPSALKRLHEANVSSICVFPLFPQYAEASTGSVLAKIAEVQKASAASIDTTILPAFFDDPGWVSAFAEAARDSLESAPYDHVLFSFHGIPERQIKKSDPSGTWCLANSSCCDAVGERNPHCYRAQCYANARALAQQLNLGSDQWSVSFQSRLGATPWIRPFTDEVLPELAARDIKNLVVACPSFVADCLETLEEIGLRAREQWTELGGEELTLLPCPNDHPAWAGAVATMVRAAVTPDASASATATPSR